MQGRRWTRKSDRHERRCEQATQGTSTLERERRRLRCPTGRTCARPVSGTPWLALDRFAPGAKEPSISLLRRGLRPGANRGKEAEGSHAFHFKRSFSCRTAIFQRERIRQSGEAGFGQHASVSLDLPHAGEQSAVQLDHGTTA